MLSLILEYCSQKLDLNKYLVSNEDRTCFGHIASAIDESSFRKESSKLFQKK